MYACMYELIYVCNVCIIIIIISVREKGVVAWVICIYVWTYVCMYNYYYFLA